MFDIQLEDMIEKKESQYFDRKSARIKPKDIIRHVVAFANADGGLLAIGIEDDGELTGTNYQGAFPKGDYELEINTGTRPNPVYKVQEVKFTKKNNEEDSIYVFDIETSPDAVIRTANENVFLRIGDNSKQQTHPQINQLEFSKGERIFEDHVLHESSIEDINEELLIEYKKIIHAEHLNDEKVLTARRFMKDGSLTVAGILLFGENPFLYLPQSRIRLLRYDGVKRQTGQRLNLIKDQDFEGPIPILIRNIKEAVAAQLREFQYLNQEGRFETIPEYPEFAWFEGVVNSLVHRDYSFRGDYIRVSMYDDRLEIFSPGSLPNIVTLENMRETRYARNPRIARTLTEFGWVRELNEGVNRIYDEMQHFYLKKPEYSEPNDNSVLLKLENNYLTRSLRTNDRIDNLKKQLSIESLSSDEHKVLSYLFNNSRITTKATGELIDKSNITASRLLQKLAGLEIIEWNGTSVTDPKQYYNLKTEDLSN